MPSHENSLEASNDASAPTGVSNNFDRRDIRRRIQAGAKATILNTTTIGSSTASAGHGEMTEHKNENLKTSAGRSPGIEWEAKSAFAARGVTIGDAAGMNAGFLPSTKIPADMIGMAAARVAERDRSVTYSNVVGSLSTASTVGSNIGGSTGFGSATLLHQSAGMRIADSLGLINTVNNEGHAKVDIDAAKSGAGAAIIQIEKESGILDGRVEIP